MEKIRTTTPAIRVTVEQLTQAAKDYELILPAEIEATYRTLLQVPAAGTKITQGLQQALLEVQKGTLGMGRVLDAAVVPAFLLGILVGQIGSSGHQRP